MKSLEHPLPIHQEIHNKLEYFIANRKIPNIIFYGSHGCGKTHILHQFISSIYGGDKTSIKNYVMKANCAHGKGIRFIREELKFFAKTNIDLQDGSIFKSVILTNADKLTIDAQSALRRCIELFSYSTRFFIVVENKQKLLKPILSRFCEIYVPDKFENGVFKSWRPLKCYADVTHFLSNPVKSHQEYIALCNSMYEGGISCLDLVAHIAKTDDSVWFCFEKVKSEFRNEKLLMLYMLDYAYIRSERDLHNVSFL